MISSWNQIPSKNILCSKSNSFLRCQKRARKGSSKCWVKERWKLRPVAVKMLILVSAKKVTTQIEALLRPSRKRGIAKWDHQSKLGKILKLWTLYISGYRSRSKNRPRRRLQILLHPFKLEVKLWSKSLSTPQKSPKEFSKSSLNLKISR